jgi:hypothetical protein
MWILNKLFFFEINNYWIVKVILNYNKKIIINVNIKKTFMNIRMLMIINI